MLRSFGILFHPSLAIQVGVLVFACLNPSAYAQNDNLEHQGKWSYQLSTDAWYLNASANRDDVPGFVEQSTNLFLPNSKTKWGFKNTSPSGWVIGKQNLMQDTELSLKAQVGQTLGMRIDEAQILKNISPSFGLRAGVVDYKTSWCRTYESDNAWMREIEAICNTPQFRDVTGGAPGVQLFMHKMVNDYLVQGQIGYYDPLLFGYATKEFGNLLPSPRFEVKSNKKYGFNVNALDTYTGVEARLSFIHTVQSGYLPEADLRGQFKQKSNLVYAGLNMPLTENLRSRITHTRQIQKAACHSEVAHIGSSCNLNLNQEKTSTSIELTYLWDAKNTISTGFSKLQMNTYQQVFTPSADIYAEASPTQIASQQTAAAWRHEWDANVFTVVQYISSQQKTFSAMQPFPSHGYAVGFRLGYQF